MSLQEFKLYSHDRKKGMSLFEKPVAGTQVSGKPFTPRPGLLAQCRTHVALRPLNLVGLALFGLYPQPFRPLSAWSTTLKPRHR